MRSLWLMWGAAALLAGGCGSEGDDLFGTASSSGNGGAGGEAGTSTTSSGTGGSSAEDCLNSSDDDNNGLIDCQDPACQSDYQCVPLPPAGWLGVGYLSGKPAADCPDEMDASEDLYEAGDLSAAPASCTCTCTGAGATECKVPLTCYGSQGCSSSPMSIEVGSTCQTQPFAPSMSFSCTAGQPFPQGGTCAVGSVEVDVPPLSWPSSKSACLIAQGGFCDAASVCVPRKPANTSGPCIAKSGNLSCPAGYAQKSVYYDGMTTDNRGCGACTCSSSPIGATCGCSGSNCGAVIFDQPGCTTGVVASVPTTGQCVNGSSSQSTLYARTSGVQLTSPGSCGPGTVSPSGNVSYAQGAITVCCDL